MRETTRGELWITLASSEGVFSAFDIITGLLSVQAGVQDVDSAWSITYEYSSLSPFRSYDHFHHDKKHKWWA
jgi:hypothetical protein